MGQFANAKVRKTGRTGIIFTGDEWDTDPVRGQVWRLHYESAGPEGCTAWYNVFKGQNSAASLRRSGVKSQLTATVSGSQLLDERADNWQLLNNVVQRSIFKSPLALSLTSGDLAFVRATYNDLTEQDADSAQAAFDAMPDGGVKTMLGYLLQGTTHFDVSQPVLKYSGSISNFYLGTVQTSDADMIKIWTPNSLLTTFAIPPFESQRISSYVAPSAPPNYTFGWLQLGSTIITDSHNRKNLSTEWILDNWSSDFYEVV